MTKYAISAAGLDLIREHEGVPEADAAALASDLAPTERAVCDAVTQPLSQSQYDALASFAFSVGADAFAQSQVLRRVNAGQFLAAACAMEGWRKVELDGELVVAGALVRRRAAEKALFLQDVACAPAPSAWMPAKLDHAAAILGAPIEFESAIAAPAAAPTTAQRLTQILKSEPATEALLLTEIVPDDVDEEEITTAHAKPVARNIAVEEGDRIASPGELLGLLSLLLVGLALMSVGGSMLFGGSGDAMDVTLAGLIAAPGLAAALGAAFWLRTQLVQQPARVQA